MHEMKEKNGLKNMMTDSSFEFGHGWGFNYNVGKVIPYSKSIGIELFLG